MAPGHVDVELELAWDLTIIHLGRWSDSSMILVTFRLLCLCKLMPGVSFLWLWQPYLVTSHANPPVRLLHAVVTMTLQPKIYIGSPTQMCTPVQSDTISTTLCSEPYDLHECMWCCHRFSYLVVCYVVQPVYAHKRDQTISNVTFQIFTLTDGLMCRECEDCNLSIEPLAFWSLWQPCSATVRLRLRGLVSMYNVRQKRRLTAGKATKFNKTSLPHEHQSFETSSIHLLLHSSKTPASRCFCTHTYTITAVLGQWVGLC